MKDDTNKKISKNMTPFFLQLLAEDVEHWRRTTETETDMVTSTAAAQQSIIRTAIKLKKEFARSAF